MVINLKQLYEIPGEKLELDAQVSPERLSEIHGYSFIGPVTLKGVFSQPCRYSHIGIYRRCENQRRVRPMLKQL